MVTGPAHQFFTRLASSMGSFYEPSDVEREEYLKALEQAKR
jgi:hypothetical protein